MGLEVIERQSGAIALTDPLAAARTYANGPSPTARGGAMRAIWPRFAHGAEGRGVSALPAESQTPRGLSGGPGNNGSARHDRPEIGRDRRRPSRRRARVADRARDGQTHPRGDPAREGHRPTSEVGSACGGFKTNRRAAGRLALGSS